MIQEILIIKIRWWIPLLLYISLAVSGCSLFYSTKKEVREKVGDTEMEYATDYEKIPPLDIPPDLTGPTTDDRYVVPDINPSESKTYSAYSKERAGGKKDRDSAPLLPEASGDSMVRIERSGTQRWLVVGSEPERVWPIVKEFWKVMGFRIKLEIPEAGVIETDWAENRSVTPQNIVIRALSTIERDKFRSRLERGEYGTTEVYISHRAMEGRLADPDLEAEMLARLMVHFGVTKERAKSVLASSSTKERAHLNSKNGSVLTVDEAFDRSWRRVGLALDRIGFTVEDRDRSEGVYFVRYVDPDTSIEEDDDEMWGILALFSDDTDEGKSPDQYRIQVSEGEGGSEVKVLSQDGKPENSDTAERILKLLYEQLK